MNAVFALMVPVGAGLLAVSRVAGARAFTAYALAGSAGTFLHLALYLLERFVLVHLCAEPGPNALLAARATEVHGHGSDHRHGDGTGCDVHTLGMAAFLGMSLHTVLDGFALGAASAGTRVDFLVFLAILAAQGALQLLPLRHPPGRGLVPGPAPGHERGLRPDGAGGR